MHSRLSAILMTVEDERLTSLRAYRLVITSAVDPAQVSASGYCV
jgi:hypothetical protein